ncbi:MAG: nucleotidyltransferase family protein [Chloroflexota bacterium]|nr:nucleotidyltransferase family protein [Chloroflexota bacterium]
MAEPALGTVDTLPPDWEVTRLATVLGAHLTDLRARYGLESVALFGSYVRNEQRPDSDLDVLVTFSRRLGMFDLIHAEDDLKERLGVPVDLVLRSELGPRILRYVLREAVVV